jgi:hypothetical protein
MESQCKCLLGLGEVQGDRIIVQVSLGIGGGVRKYMSVGIGADATKQNHNVSIIIRLNP